MSYTALYRKYRPTTFDDMVGQFDVIETLKNQVTTGKVGHAYLFSGTRGTGKTSAAKIFSRAINCLNPQGYNPCNVCDVCRGILDEALMDVIEMDAASNNGVDDVREIRDNVKFPPSKAKYKVYIIDEVHMLSAGAFNALLKTLEEPPSYMVFILATTEPHKIPNTIHSRCQKYDFRRVSHNDILHRLEKVCELSGFQYEPEALELIVRKCDGSVRDSLSTLDQCTSQTGSLTTASIRRDLGLVEDEVMLTLSKHIISHNLEGALIEADAIITSGYNIPQFVRDFQEHFRNLLMLKAGDGMVKLVERSEAYLSDLIELRSGVSVPMLVAIIERLGESENRMKWASNQRIAFETAVAGLCMMDTLEARSDLEARVVKLEAMLKNGIVERPVVQPAREVSIKPQRMASLERQQDRNVEETSSATTAQPAGKPIDLTEIQAQWERVLAAVKKKKVTIHAFIVEGRPLEIRNGQLMVGFPEGYGFHMEAVMREENRREIEEAIMKVCQMNVRLGCDFSSNLQQNYGHQVDDGDNIDKVKSFFTGMEDKLEIIE